MEYNFYDIYKSLECINSAVNEPNPTYTLEQSCNMLKHALIKFMPDFPCKEVRYTPNTDKQFFGLFVQPTLSSTGEFIRKIFKGFGEYTGEFEEFKFTGYILEIDGKLLRNFKLSHKQLWAIILGDIAALNSPEPITRLRDIIDNYIALNNISLDINCIKSFPEMFELAAKTTLHNLTSVFAKYNFSVYDDTPSIVAGFDLQTPYQEAIDIFITAGAKENEVDTTTLALSWFFANYKDFYDNRYVEHMLKDSIRIEASSCVRNMSLAAMRTIVNIDKASLAYYNTVVNESRRKGLIYQIKRNGLKSIEEDLFEYNMRLRNVETQDEAILLMRQINSRMSILEDYLRDEQDLDENDRKRWTECYEEYIKLREALSKKTVYNKKMYGLFVDYNALQNMSQTGQLMNTYY